MPEVIMPKAGDAMTEGKVVRWYKKAGDAVKKGEPVLEIETVLGEIPKQGATPPLAASVPAAAPAEDGYSRWLMGSIAQELPAIAAELGHVGLLMVGQRAPEAVAGLITSFMSA